MIRGILGLSFGTAVTRGLSAVGQLLLAIWLSPTEFGYWAAAVSVISILTGLANFGEVNGYLSGQGSGFSRVRQITRRQNSVLAAVGVVIAGIYAVADRWEVAVLAAVVALTIPLVGDAELMYSTGVKFREYKRVVVAQSFAAAIKIGLGVWVASATSSAISIAVSTAAFYLSMDVALSYWVASKARLEAHTRADVSRKTRVKWASNSLSMTLPLQVGFLVAQFAASPALLGVYYFAYQVTLGISGLVSVPLARVSLSTLGTLEGAKRLRAALTLSSWFGAGMVIAAGLATLVLPFVQPLVPFEWQAAVPATVILLASLPARMMSPVVDAFQQAENKWWQSTIFNAADTVGTAAAALTILSGDIIVLVLSLTAWKVVLSVSRIIYVFRSAEIRQLILLVLPVLISSTSLCLASIDAFDLSILWAALALGIGALWAMAVRRMGKRNEI